MQRLLPAIALCALLHTAMAGTPQTAPPRADALPASASVAPRPQAQAQRSADTVTVAVAMQGDPSTASDARAASKDTAESHHEPTGTAMLLVALALMTGIAWRHRGAGRE